MLWRRRMLVGLLIRVCWVRVWVMVAMRRGIAAVGGRTVLTGRRRETIATHGWRRAIIRSHLTVLVVTWVRRVLHVMKRRLSGVRLLLVVRSVARVCWWRGHWAV